MRPQENSLYGPIKFPISSACALLACRTACLAAIPCMITEFRNVANVSPQSSSGVGSQPATSAYHLIHFEREGRPGVLADGEKAGLVRTDMAELGGLTAKQYGVSKFERSDKGCPIVDISQLYIVAVSQLAEVARLLEATYSMMPITLGSVL